MRTVSILVLILFVAALGLFCVQNMAEGVRIVYLKWQLIAPLPMLALLIYLLGMVSGWAVVGFLRKTIREATTHAQQAPSA